MNDSDREYAGGELEHSQRAYLARELELTPLGPPDPEQVRETYRKMAVANAETAAYLMTCAPERHWVGTPEDAALMASTAVRACRQHQLWGGKPTDGGTE